MASRQALSEAGGSDEWSCKLPWQIGKLRLVRLDASAEEVDAQLT
ncbi:hypothetical protein PF004_g23396, partial [Phytophthora fragariae]